MDSNALMTSHRATDLYWGTRDSTGRALYLETHSRHGSLPQNSVSVRTRKYIVSTRRVARYCRHRRFAPSRRNNLPPENAAIVHVV